MGEEPKLPAIRLMSLGEFYSGERPIQSAPHFLLHLSRQSLLRITMPTFPSNNAQHNAPCQSLCMSTYFNSLYESYQQWVENLTPRERLSEFATKRMQSMLATQTWSDRERQLWKLMLVLAVPQLRNFVNAWKEDCQLIAPGIPDTDDLPDLERFPLQELEATPEQAQRIVRYWVDLEAELSESEVQLLSSQEELTAAAPHQWSSIDEKLRSMIAERKSSILAEFLPRLVRLIDKNMSPSLRRKEGSDDVAHSVVRVVLQMEEDGKLAIEESESFWKLLVTISIRRVQKKARFWSAGKRSLGREINLPEEIPLEELALTVGDLTDAVGARAGGLLSQLNEQLTADEKVVLDGKIQDLTGEQIAEELGKSRRQVQRLWKNILDRLRSLFEQDEL